MPGVCLNTHRHDRAHYTYMHVCMKVCMFPCTCECMCTHKHVCVCVSVWIVVTPHTAVQRDTYLSYRDTSSAASTSTSPVRKTGLPDTVKDRGHATANPSQFAIPADPHRKPTDPEGPKEGENTKQLTPLRSAITRTAQRGGIAQEISIHSILLTHRERGLSAHRVILDKVQDQNWNIFRGGKESPSNPLSLSLSALHESLG